MISPKAYRKGNSYQFEQKEAARIENRTRKYNDRCFERRAQIESILIKDRVDRAEKLVEQLAELLEKEFKIFKELARETPDEL